MSDEFRTKPLYFASCQTCGKYWEAQNAHGVAAKHARKHKHRVIVDVTISWVYDHEELKNE